MLSGIILIMNGKEANTDSDSVITYFSRNKSLK